MTLQMVLFALYKSNSDTRADLAKKFDVSPNRISGAVCDLKQRGLVSSSKRGIYTITQAGREFIDGGGELSVTNSLKALPLSEVASPLYSAAWWHLRAHRRATITEIMKAHCSDGESKTSNISLRTYLQALARAGILSKSRPHHLGEIFWGIAKDVGRKAPVWRRVRGEVFDPNSGVPIFVAASDRAFKAYQAEKLAAGGEV